MLINGKHDDIKAIILTAVQEYGLLWRLPLALLLAAILCVLLKHWLRTPTHAFVTHSRKETVGKSVLILAGITVFWVFVRFGGSFGYTHSVNWENASRLRSNLLNEAVLDDRAGPVPGPQHAQTHEKNHGSHLYGGRTA